MVEVFKTTVRDPFQANMLLNQIHETFSGYQANFDLEDCDKILRVQTPGPGIEAELLIFLLRDFGFKAEILPD